MRKHQFLVIGLGRFGTAVATTLYQLGHEVVAIDEHEENVQRVMNHVTHVAMLDATDERALSALGIQDFDVVIVAIGADVKANILTTVAAKSAGAKYVVSKAVDDMTRRVLEKVGADLVVRPEHDMGVRLARKLVRPHSFDDIDLGTDYAIAEVTATGRIEGTLKDLNLTNRFGVQVIALKTGSQVRISPKADDRVVAHDTLVVVGTLESVERLISYTEDT
ncbi:potassium channel family protein [Deinococcus cellulosilyticus]|uniref:Potassium transporter Trk n=1 Tax=Deinococcus cellulosilyticus (strain DSM 18568 / NBRC 106333 / KACC 11606 / 5516J-15) TaxID=1223518 RepID=A0A511N8V8_DEIC1|nr:TrkA family potassium uptake protein [Deinococcus cellulosilyticus]GEM49264.1 potassium transporter Trk [Deinococcus cellulosilyticus NBRC 106333 = KACC 11606]